MYSNVYNIILCFNGKVWPEGLNLPYLSTIRPFWSMSPQAWNSEVNVVFRFSLILRSTGFSIAWKGTHDTQKKTAESFYKIWAFAERNLFSSKLIQIDGFCKSTHTVALPMAQEWCTSCPPWRKQTMPLDSQTWFCPKAPKRDFSIEYSWDSHVYTYNQLISWSQWSLYDISTLYWYRRTVLQFSWWYIFDILSLFLWTDYLHVFPKLPHPPALARASAWSASASDEGLGRSSRRRARWSRGNPATWVATKWLAEATWTYWITVYAIYNYYLIYTYI